jgi:hypothetical protein
MHDKETDMPSREAEADGDNAVVQWFGDGFAQLHPLLQALHRNSGVLGGQVQLQFGKGLAGAVGRRLVRRLGVPESAGPHRLDVDIRHDATTLHWNRCFDRKHHVRSRFRPEGHWPGGHWVERTGPLEIELAVDIVEGGWHWRPLAVRVHGVRMPMWLVPRSRAYKRIEDGRYRFFVGFTLPFLGEVFSYSGLLEARLRG